MQINIPDLYGTEKPNILALKLVDGSHHLIDVRHLFEDGYLPDTREVELGVINTIYNIIKNDLYSAKLQLRLMSEATRVWYISKSNGYMNDNSN